MRTKLYLSALLLLLMHLPTLAQIGGDYNPDNPGDPGTPVVKHRHTLTLKVLPASGGSCNVTSTQVAVDEVYNIRAYNNTDFAFVAWVCEGDTISKAASYNITMPDRDLEITAVFKYNPNSPGDPTDQALKYQLSLRADPVNSGSFNINNERYAVGSSPTLRAYTNTDFVFKHWRIGDSILSTNQEMVFQMPAHNVEIIGQFEYNPGNPPNPNANYWNPITGEVIVDDFTPGNLSGAITALLNRYGANKNDVQMITVAGKITSNDFGIANNYPNCTLLDLSRVTGVTEVPSYAFDYTNLESVYLPATIEKIGERAFYQCTKLSSLTIYAMTPPQLGSNVFTGVPEGLVVYVPAAAIPQYQNDPNWGKFIILPIQEDIKSLTVNLPANANPADYTNMWLELINTKSDQRMHYVMTDKMSYKFNNIIRNTTWNVVLRNPNGDVFGQINNVEVEDEDVTVTFASLSKPYRVNLNVLTPAGQNVTSQVVVTWTDAEGNYLSQEPSLSGLPEGYQLIYSVKLPQELAMAYNVPAAAQYTVVDGNNDVFCRLETITKLTLSGKVKDAKTGLPLNDATITASQTFADRYDKTLSTKSDQNGLFSMEIAKVPTVVGAAASDYVSKSVACDVVAANGDITLADVLLDPITGATIAVDFTYTPAHGETETAEVQNWYADYNNVDFTVYNKTKSRAITQFSAQYPQIVLLETVNDGDMLELTATSRKDAFKPVKTTVTVAEQKATATFDIVELGQIAASFNRNENESVVGTLYDANGKLLNTGNYSNATLSFTDLKDGNYTLVTMGQSSFFNTIYDLAQLPQTGLSSGVDYVQKSVQVNSGIIKAVVIDEVPTLDESKLYYTGENTSFTVNKPSIVIGNYLTMTGHLDFKPAYAASVSNVRLIVDIPESCSFVENSVMVGNNTSGYTINGNQITIPMARYTDRVRFCVIPTVGGNFAPSAFAQFDFNGKTITQPIGAANYTAKELSISLPSTVAKTEIPVSGTAIGVCDVNIYDNNILIGHTTSLANGSWSIKCVLNDAFDMSVHNIYAEVTTSTGLKLMTENKSCVYDKSAIKVSSVTMINTAHPSGNLDLCQYTTVFDFLNPASSLPAYWYWPSYPDFTFLIDFTNNDTTLISNVVLDVYCSNNEVVSLRPVYDGEIDKYIITEKFSSHSLPRNVGVNYFYLNLHMADSVAIIGNLKNDYNEVNLEDIFDTDNVLSYSVIPKDKSLAVRCAYIRASINKKAEVYNKVSSSSFEKINIGNEGIGYYMNSENAIQIIKETSDSIFVFASFDYNDSISFFDYVSLMRGNSHLMNKAPRRGWSVDYGSDHISPSTDALNQWRDHIIQRAIDEANSKLPCADEATNIYIHDAVKRLRQTVGLQLGGFLAYFFGFGLAATPGSHPIERVYQVWDAAGNTGTFAEGISGLSAAAQDALRTIHNAPDCDPPKDGERYPGDDAPHVMDPSGFVYEGVPSNRLPGVTATCFYKETVEDMYGDTHEEIVLWDASQYAQENPLFTDEYGCYRWDVPVGLWQVKFEKAGYETTFSDWLPVPPPQLDINIAMTQMSQPEVIKARAYPQAVVFEFDKYMKPETLNTHNITVTVNGANVGGSIALLNEENAADGSDVKYASRVRFNANSPFNADEVTLHVSHLVENYAGLHMSDDYEQTLEVEDEIVDIEVDTVLNVQYGGARKLTVTVLPANASMGKTLNVRTSSPTIATVDAESYTLDNNGQAEVVVQGCLPGMASLLFGIEGYDLSANTLVNVVMDDPTTVALPTASIASGSVVEKGTAVYLYCKTEGATIYYTLDGSCPCDPSDARKVYDGTPIIINGNVTIKAMAVAEGLYDSDVATFIYRVPGLKGDVNGDGTVNISDINQLIDYILRDRINSETLERGDVNGDGTINISDINVVIQIILGSGSGAHAPVNTADLLHMNDLELRPGEMGDLRVTVDNAAQYSAMQCDIVLPEGLTLVGVTPAIGNMGQSGTVDDMTSRALTYSMIKNPFTVGLPVLTLTVRADRALGCDGLVSLTNVVLSDADNASWYAEGCTAMVNNASGVIDQTAAVDHVWTEGHTLCISTRQDGVARVSAVNGMMRRLDISAGVTRLTLEPGIYIVVLNGKSHKVLIK